MSQQPKATRNAAVAGLVPADLVAVGRVTGAYGVRGWIKVAPFAGDQSVLLGKPAVWIGRNKNYLNYQLDTVREHSGQLVACLRDQHGELLTDRNRAEQMKGQELAVSRQQFPATEVDEFYWGDLIGCRVINEAGDTLGQVIRIEDHGADPVMLIQSEPVGGEAVSRGQKRLVPFVGHFVRDVDLASRTIRVDWALDWD
jgi:16S rRNA processing protein RimM